MTHDADPTLSTVVSEQGPIRIEDLKGTTIGSTRWRIIHALKPCGNARYGGFILERTE